MTGHFDHPDHPLPRNYWSTFAASMAMSNMGLGLPPVEDIRRCMNTRSPMKASEIVLDLAQQYIEDSASEDAFQQEAEAWEQSLTAIHAHNKNLNSIQKYWPHAVARMNEACKSE